jgi:hypothetical protein
VRAREVKIAEMAVTEPPTARYPSSRGRGATTRRGAARTVPTCSERCSLPRGAPSIRRDYEPRRAVSVEDLSKGSGDRAQFSDADGRFSLLPSWARVRPSVGLSCAGL